LRKFLPIPSDYLSLMHDLIEPLAESKFSREELTSTGVLDFLIEQALQKGDTTTAGALESTTNDRIASICNVFL